MNSYWFPVNRYITPPTLAVTSASMGITTAGYNLSGTQPVSTIAVSGATIGMAAGTALAGILAACGVCLI